MITQVKLPTVEDLQPLLDEALETAQSKEAFIQAQVDGIYKTLKANPLMYRHYGAYWWAVKSLMTKHGYDLGSDSEVITEQHFNFEDPAILLCAAWAYQQEQVDKGYWQAKLHTYYADDEEFEYSIEDVNLEAWSVNSKSMQ